MVETNKTTGMKDIWEASRDGDLNRVQYLIEFEKVNINQSDNVNIHLFLFISLYFSLNSLVWIYFNSLCL